MFGLQTVNDAGVPFASDTPAGATCLADCYTGLGEACEYKDLDWFKSSYGTVSKEDYCNYQWAGIDNGYNDLKVCAAKAIANPTAIMKRAYVNSYRGIKATELRLPVYILTAQALI